MDEKTANEIHDSLSRAYRLSLKKEGRTIKDRETELSRDIWKAITIAARMETFYKLLGEDDE